MGSGEREKKSVEPEQPLVASRSAVAFFRAPGVEEASVCDLIQEIDS